MKLYKLTDENDRTYGGCQWGEGVEHTASGEGDLCGHGWLHAYTDPLLAALLNPIHADFQNPHLWEADGDVGCSDCGLKVGCTRLRTTQQIPLPEVTLEDRVRFGILAVKKVYYNPRWTEWADDWISGADRSARSAKRAAAEAAWAAARAAAEAAWAAARAAAESARAAARAAWAAARAAALDLPAIALVAAGRGFTSEFTVDKLGHGYDNGNDSPAK
jgi:hypothetical protein